MNMQDGQAHIFTSPAATADDGEGPIISSTFAVKLLQFFGGGHTPAVRDALLSLVEAATEAEQHPRS